MERCRVSKLPFQSIRLICLGIFLLLIFSVVHITFEIETVQFFIAYCFLKASARDWKLQS